jgi:hypothetical protein
MGDHFQGLGKPPYSEKRGESGTGNLAATIKAIIAGGAITAAGIGSASAVAQKLAVPETTASGAPMPQDKNEGWGR